MEIETLPGAALEADWGGGHSFLVVASRVAAPQDANESSADKMP
jgi:hypothetical protein